MHIFLNCKVVLSKRKQKYTLLFIYYYLRLCSIVLVYNIGKCIIFTLSKRKIECYFFLQIVYVIMKGNNKVAQIKMIKQEHDDVGK